MRYELEPWTPIASELTGPTCDYGPTFVKQRDREHSDRRRRGAVGELLGLALPTVGVLGSDTKRHIEERYGIRPVGATRTSQYVEAVIVLASGTLLVSGALVPVLGHPAPWPLWPFALAALVLSPDPLMRYVRLIREEPHPPGFYRWVRPRKGGRS